MPRNPKRRRGAGPGVASRRAGKWAPLPERIARVVELLRTGRNYEQAGLEGCGVRRATAKRYEDKWERGEGPEGVTPAMVAQYRRQRDANRKKADKQAKLLKKASKVQVGKKNRSSAGKKKPKEVAASAKGRTVAPPPAKAITKKKGSSVAGITKPRRAGVQARPRPSSPSPSSYSDPQDHSPVRLSPRPRPPRPRSPTPSSSSYSYPQDYPPVRPCSTRPRSPGSHSPSPSSSACASSSSRTQARVPGEFRFSFESSRSPTPNPLDEFQFAQPGWLFDIDSDD